ncbi:MAG: PH domain-containing protein [Chloroflexi bacterium]|nr:PH domain-containing protein [Chloroflexota bacterium]MCY3937304.1 PH domain-containing protein [Chloroflexota bacterium]
MSEQSDRPGVTGEVLLEAQFDSKISPYYRWLVSLVLLITLVGIPLIPLWLIFSVWYGREYLRRISARLTTQAVEIRKGVFFRKEATIPLDRITDVRLHDDPLMRMHKLRGLKVETAGQSGQNAGSEGDLIGIIDAVEFRDAVLLQRQRVLDAEPSAAPAKSVGGTNELLTEIRDILERMEAKG